MSLSISDYSQLFGLEAHEKNYAFHQLGRQSENNPHPYVFFNADKATFTFLGVKVQNTNLIDCNGAIIARGVMPNELEQQIKRQAYDEPCILGENVELCYPSKVVLKNCTGSWALIMKCKHKTLMTTMS